MSELGFDFGAKLLEVSDLDSHGVKLSPEAQQVVVDVCHARLGGPEEHCWRDNCAQLAVVAGAAAGLGRVRHRSKQPSGHPKGHPQGTQDQANGLEPR